MRSPRAFAARLVHLAAKEIGIAGVQQPEPVVVPDRDTSMAPGMTGQRHHEDLGGQTFEIAHRVEPEP